jgi:uncharacterized protein (TIGR02646 family)
MIRVGRSRLDDAGNVIQPLGTWLEDADNQTAIAIAEVAGGAKHEITALYKHDNVKVALEELFYRKCAYCEAGGLLQFAWDVEHFRPKGRVAEDPNHGGYYWLAYTWTNLFPSCPTCNQRRKDKRTYADPSTGQSEGKLDQFPLLAGSLRAAGPNDDISNERPAILNPCTEDPSNHLRLGADGKLRPAPNSALGAKSISVFALNRTRACVDREEALRKIAHFVRTAIQRGIASNEALDIALEVMEDPRIAYSFVAKEVRRDPVAFGY